MRKVATMQLSAAERTQGRLNDDTLAEALRTVRDTGLVVLDNVYDRGWVDALFAAYNEALEQHIAARGGMEGINAKSFGRNHIGMHLPLVTPFSDPQIVANPIAVQVMQRLIGDDLQCSFYHSNTAYPGSGYQPIHRDWPPLFGSELGVPHPPVALVLNIPLCDFSEENGSTEVWPGTHLLVDATPNEGKQLEARVATLPSIRTNVKAGSIIVRDLRTWHRGVPNRSDRARAMLAIVYQRSWLAVSKLLDIPQATWEAWPDQARKIFRNNIVAE
jgi:ectoine hydroxylase-related dioxygenase (phytanoyl-CoA dioxygenase family)